MGRGGEGGGCGREGISQFSSGFREYGIIAEDSRAQGEGLLFWCLALDLAGFGSAPELKGRKAGRPR